MRTPSGEAGALVFTVTPLLVRFFLSSVKRATALAGGAAVNGTWSAMGELFVGREAKLSITQAFSLRVAPAKAGQPASIAAVGSPRGNRSRRRSSVEDVPEGVTRWGKVIKLRRRSLSAIGCSCATG